MARAARASESRLHSFIVDQPFRCPGGKANPKLERLTSRGIRHRTQEGSVKDKLNALAVMAAFESHRLARDSGKPELDVDAGS